MGDTISFLRSMLLSFCSFGKRRFLPLQLVWAAYRGSDYKWAITIRSPATTTTTTAATSPTTGSETIHWTWNWKLISWRATRSKKFQNKTIFKFFLFFRPSSQKCWKSWNWWKWNVLKFEFCFFLRHQIKWNMIFEIMSVHFLEDGNYVETLHENIAGTKFVLAVSCFSSQYGFRHDFFSVTSVAYWQ